MSDLGLTPPAPILLSTSLSDQHHVWENWISTLEFYFEAANIQKSKRKKALLLYIGGEELRRIHKTFNEEYETYNETRNQFEEYFHGKINLTFERNTFRCLTPQSDESNVHFITRLKTQSLKCDFNNYSSDHAICDQFIEKCQDKKLRRELLSDSKLTLDKLIELATTSERVEKYASVMETNCREELNALTSNADVPKGNRNSNYNNYSNNSRTASQRQFNRPTNTNNNNQGPRFRQVNRNQVGQRVHCYGCGSSNHVHGNQSCPAMNKKCNHCGRFNHFESECNAKKNGLPQTLNALDSSERNENDESNEVCSAYEEQNEDNEYLFALNDNQLTDITVNLDNQPVTFLIDSGARRVNILDRSSLRRIQNKTKIVVHPTNAKIFAYGSNTPLALDGVIYCNAEYEGTHSLARIHIFSLENSGNILGRDTATDLGLLKIKETVNTIQTDKLDEIRSKYPAVFSGLGKLKDVKLKLNIDTSVQPVSQHLRRVPFHVRQKVENKLNELLDLDVIERVEGPTSWVSPILAIPKGNDVRLVVDMRAANTAILRNHRPVPTLEELMDDFTGCAYFSKIDLRHGYHQIELDEDSRHITTFITHVGCFRYKRLVQGANSALEEYQHHIDSLFSHQKRIRNISDDILVGGSTKSEHDHNLDTCFKILNDNNLTVNSQKCQIGLSEITFFGHTISSKGIHPSINKIEAIKAFPKSTCRKDISSFLGMLNYLTRFIPNLASETAPLRRLLRKDIPWQWTDNEDTVFNRLKDLLSSELVVAHYDQNLPSSLIVDASPEGLGAILVQKQSDGKLKPVYYASRALTIQEKKILSN